MSTGARQSRFVDFSWLMAHAELSVDSSCKPRNDKHVIFTSFAGDLSQVFRGALPSIHCGKWRPGTLTIGGEVIEREIRRAPVVREVIDSCHF